MTPYIHVTEYAKSTSGSFAFNNYQFKAGKPVVRYSGSDGNMFDEDGNVIMNKKGRKRKHEKNKKNQN